jgi:hypothetical protein
LTAVHLIMPCHCSNTCKEADVPVLMLPEVHAKRSRVWRAKGGRERRMATTA